MDIYVYYRVPEANALMLRPRLQSLQQSLAEEYTIQHSLKRRPEPSEGCQTWMEVYHQVPEDFAAALHKAVDDHGLMALIRGERHVEVFVDVDTCA